MTWLRSNGMINPELLLKYVTEKLENSNDFFRSGVVEVLPELTAAIASGGLTGKMPFYKALSGESESLGDDTTDVLTVNSTTTDAEIYHVLARGKAFGASDLAKAFSGDDPMKALGDMLAEYWSADLNASLIASLKGIADATTPHSVLYDYSSTSDGKITAAATVNAKAVMGDRSKKLVAIAMHSAVKAKLAKDQLITYLRSADYNVEIPNYLGMTVIEDDSLVPTGDVYTSVLFSAGAVGYGGNVAPVPFETDRHSLGGYDVLVSRSHHVIHPRGFAFNPAATSAGPLALGKYTPTNAELAEDRWTRVFKTKNCGFVLFKHKV